ncbi:MAG: ureidoglycolate lyase [Gammaproteobacteria bacterium]
MSDRQIHLHPLTAAAFLPFGQVIAAGCGVSSSANGGNAERFDALATLTHAPVATAPTMAVYRAQPMSLPFTIQLLERHPHSSQAFIPMTVEQFIVITALPTAQGDADLDTLKAFIGERGQGINYRPGIWHYPIVVLHQQADLLMFMWEAETDNCIFQNLPQPITITA